jgi:hypothetical protein
MKKNLFIFVLMASASLAIAQQPKFQDTITLKKVMELKVVGEGGANGASVTWNPLLKKYYAGIAGNQGFPMTVFDINGKRLSDTSVKTLIDLRGLWYNSRIKLLQANAYSNFGWASYKLNPNGIPVSYTQFFEGQNQPTDQSVGTYDGKNDVVYFLTDEDILGVASYSMKDGAYLTTVSLHPGTILEEDIDEGLEIGAVENYNYTTLVYTGKPTTEIGLLNIDLNQIELYNLANGLMSRVLLLPEGAPVNDIFNFSYCNGIYWLFDKDKRTWFGYK